MASTVTVFETSARRTVIKVTPGKYLHEVRAEACAKFGLSPDRYGLKNNNKTLDLSTPFRHAGLVAGARLELTLLSRSAGVVSVALQLPDSEAAGISNTRLVDKFPSTTTLWQILRKFEDGVAGGNTKRNLTARGIPRMSNGDVGAGRLYWEQPVLVVQNKELFDFVDLQKTLSTLGLNTGSVLIRLSFRPSEQPFEEAQEKIGQYFHEVEGGEKELASIRIEQTQEVGLADRKEIAAVDEPPRGENKTDSQRVNENNVAGSVVVSAAAATPTTTTVEPSPIVQAGNIPEQTRGITDRPTTVFSAPSNSTPAAARSAHNEADFEYTIEHAQIQNAQYKAAGRNRPLPSDAEVETKKLEAASKLAAIQSVKIRTRFPDNTQAIAEFTKQDTGQDLYSYIRPLLTYEDAPFVLQYRGAKGIVHIPNDRKRLIQDVGLTGDMTINLTWQGGAGAEVRRVPVLKAQVTANAKQIEVPVVKDEIGPVDKENQALSKPEKSERKTGGVPAWLKKTLPGGKK